MDWAGGGRASARETVGRVMAGAVAFRVLKRLCPNLITSCYVQQVAGIVMKESTPNVHEHKNIYATDNPMRCPESATAMEMQAVIEDAKKRRDSVGSIVVFAIKNLPVGLGDPVFDKLHADIAKAILSLPAVKGIEFGSGFGCAELEGSKNNDVFVMDEAEVRTSTNHAGGILGGISTGEVIYGRVAFKPPSSIGQEQSSIDTSGKQIKLDIGGRHDPCLGPRAVPIVECSIANVILDHVLRNYLVQSVRSDFSKENLTRRLNDSNTKR